MISSEFEETRKKFVELLREHVSCEYSGMGMDVEDKGRYFRYNGLDIHQSRDFIKLGCETYIDRMLQTHGWDAPKYKDPVSSVPITKEVADKLQTLKGPPEKTPEARQIEKNFGFAYRNLLGELMYAYVIGRMDIGFAVCLAARFCEAPHEEHFRALSRITKYLRATKEWGIIFRRPTPLQYLQRAHFNWLADDPTLPFFPLFRRRDLLALLDAAHATDLKTRRSVTGLFILFGGAAIAWKSRLQSLVATSSTEAEFYAAVFTAKLVLYFRHILEELDALADGPTILYIDNQAALHMINENRPTERARHVAVQHFAIQEWRQAKLILMAHLPGVVNSADAMTKPLTAPLLYRHCRRAMGHYHTTFLPDDSEFCPPNQRTLRAGEGVSAGYVSAPSSPSSPPGEHGSARTARRTERKKKDGSEEPLS